jgi:hypothetical protein
MLGGWAEGEFYRQTGTYAPIDVTPTEVREDEPTGLREAVVRMRANSNPWSKDFRDEDWAAVLAAAGIKEDAT